MSEHDSNQRESLSDADTELAQQIARTLQRSADTLDADTRARLATIRHQALQHSRWRRVAGGMAMAASLLALVAMPWMLRQPPHKTVADDTSYLSVDPEMLADMDMLMAIGESR